MRALITGGSGFVGRRLTLALLDHGHEVGVTVHQHDPGVHDVAQYPLDVTDREAIREAIQDFDPDVTVHTAAITDADICERKPDLARRVNVGGTRNVVSACEDIGSDLLFVSSSFVFSGDDGVYVESSPRFPVNVYGETKAEAEDLVLASSVRSIVVRTDQPYGWPEPWQPPTMVSWLLEELSGLGPVSVFDDWWNTPIYNPDLVTAMRMLVEGPHEGVFHAVGREFINRYDWARQIAEAFGYAHKRIRSTASMEAGLPATRPNARLSASKIVDETGVEPRSISAGLRDMRVRSMRD